MNPKWLGHILVVSISCIITIGVSMVLFQWKNHTATNQQITSSTYVPPNPASWCLSLGTYRICGWPDKVQVGHDKFDPNEPATSANVELVDSRHWGAWSAVYSLKDGDWVIFTQFDFTDSGSHRSTVEKFAFWIQTITYILLNR